MTRIATSALGGLVLLVIAWSAASAPRPAPASGLAEGAGDPARDGPAGALLRLLDADGDGALAGDELEKAGARLLELDTSRDGKLALDELRARLERRREGPGGGRGGYGFEFGGTTDHDRPALAMDGREKKALAQLEEMSKGRWYLNVTTREGRLLRQLTEAVGAKRVVEIGTSSGYSTIWLALGARASGGRVFTHEIDPAKVALARENFEKAGVDDVITIVQGDAHETILAEKEPIDVVFLDAEKPGYPDYLEKLLPLVRPGGLILGHDMNRPRPDPRYIEAITANPDLDSSFVLMESFGISVTLKKRSP